LFETRITFFVKETGIESKKNYLQSVFNGFRQVETPDNRPSVGLDWGAQLPIHLSEYEMPYFGPTQYLDKVRQVILIPLSENDNEKQVNTMNKAKELINWSGKTFLIVEDEEVNTQYLQELLRPTKAKLLLATSAAEALELCNLHAEIDLVLMDIKLPGMNGYEATKRIKNIRNDLPIIAQTAYAMASDRATALKSGCDDYIAKPIRVYDMLALIQKHISID
jgi:two-component system, cell cycle response regulator DivK